MFSKSFPRLLGIYIIEPSLLWWLLHGVFFLSFFLMVSQAYVSPDELSLNWSYEFKTPFSFFLKFSILQLPWTNFVEFSSVFKLLWISLGLSSVMFCCAYVWVSHLHLFLESWFVDGVTCPLTRLFRRVCSNVLPSVCVVCRCHLYQVVSEFCNLLFCGCFFRA